MPRKALKCSIELKLHAVTCPGTYVKDKDDVHLTVCLMGKHKHTQSVPPSFPFLFHEKLKFERIFWDALDPGHLTEILDEEHVLIELIQDSDIVRGGVVLADYESSAREFLYPYPTLAPTYAGVDREVLMRRTLHFDGISPKLEFSTKTVIKEIPSSAVDELRDITSIITSTSETSEVSEDSTDIIPKRTNSHKSRSKTRSKSRNTGVHSSTRPRSTSPSMKKRLANLSINDAYCSGEKPPFVVRKVDEHLLSSAPPKSEHRPGSPKKIHNSSANNNNRSASSYPHITNGHNTFQRSDNNNTNATIATNNSTCDTLDYCEHCQHPHTDRQCTVCRLYRRYIGGRYWGHAYHYHPNKSNHTHIRVHRERGGSTTSSNKIKLNSGVTQRNTDDTEISDSVISEHDSIVLSESEGKLDDFVPLDKYDSTDDKHTYGQLPNNNEVFTTPNNKHSDITPIYSPKTELLHSLSEPHYQQQQQQQQQFRCVSPSTLHYHHRRLADRYNEPHSPANKIHEKVQRLTRTHKHFDPPLILPSHSMSVESLPIHNTYRCCSHKHLDTSCSGDSMCSDTGYGSGSRSRRRLFDESLDKVYTRLFREAQSSY